MFIQKTAAVVLASTPKIEENCTLTPYLRELRDSNSLKRDEFTPGHQQRCETLITAYCGNNFLFPHLNIITMMYNQETKQASAL